MSAPARRRVVVTGMGLVSPLGDRPEAFHQALCEGRSGVRPIELFGFDGVPGGLSKVECRTAGEIAFRATDYVAGNLRPLDRTAQLVTAAAELALVDAGWTRELRAEHEVGLVLGTMFGSVHTISAFDRRVLEAGPSYAKPLDFANTVINAAAGQTAIWHDLRGLNSTVAGGTVGGLEALAQAIEAIRTGRATALLAGGADELSFESWWGFLRAGLLSGSKNGTPPCWVPFEARRNGFVLGEGAALLMLEDEAAARERGARILAVLAGHASGFDPSRGGDEASAAGSVARTVEAALDDARVAPGDVDAVSASASGSVAGDRCEARGLAAVLPRDVPVTAVKSMLGEALGTSGAYQTIALVESVRRGTLPGVRGLERRDPELAVEGAEAVARDLAVRHGLVTGRGLDGATVSVVVAAPDQGRSPD